MTPTPPASPGIATKEMSPGIYLYGNALIKDMVLTTVSGVPNQPKTPMHSIRCPDELWDAGKAAAEQLDTTITAELQKALKNLIKRAERKAKS